MLGGPASTAPTSASNRCAVSGRNSSTRLPAALSIATNTSTPSSIAKVAVAAATATVRSNAGSPARPATSSPIDPITGSPRSSTVSRPVRAVERQCTWCTSSPGRHCRMPRTSSPAPSRPVSLSCAPATGSNANGVAPAGATKNSLVTTWVSLALKKPNGPTSSRVSRHRQLTPRAVAVQVTRTVTDAPAATGSR